MKLEITRLLPIKLLSSNAVEKRDGFLSRKILEKFGLSLVILLAIPIMPVGGQIVPDESLNTDVEQQGVNQLKIDGGAREGNNLFHSFETFSIPEGIEAVFENAGDIQNIFTRVTGSEISTIEGILKTQGAANFFLINKNGIVFGENARLDVGGSFIATTAESIHFADGTEFANSDAEEEPILTVSVPIGLQFDGNSGEIQINGMGNQISAESPLAPIEFSQTPEGVLTPSGKTLALVGNGINLDGGVIGNQENGKIYLNSVNSGLVNITLTSSELNFSNNNINQYQDINLNQQSLIDASGKETGEVFLSGKNINILGESFILSQNRGAESGSSLNLEVAESFTVSGRDPKSGVRSSIRSETFAEGKGAEINITASDIYFQGGARIRSNSFSLAVGGDINVKANNLVQLSAPSSIIATTFAVGNAGNLYIAVPKLIVDASGVSSSTNGAGDSGEVEINTDLVEILGTSSTDRASISTTSFADGNANKVTINTKKLRVTDGASLSSASFANGNAGDIFVEASESVEVTGKSSNSISTSNPESTIRAAVQTVPPRARKILGLPDIPTGDGGNITINTSMLEVTQEGVITVENQGSGSGGKLTINADSLDLQTAGKITAATQSGKGGEIFLDTENLQIDENSSITATAEQNGDGGNITIKTGSLIAKKNSEVTANAFEGGGGNINIKANEGLFLFDSPENIFSASSQLGIDGTVKIETPDINLQPEVEQLTLELLNMEEEIANSCLAQNSSRGSFTVSKNGNAPKNPNSNYSDLTYSLTGIDSRTNLRRQNTEFLDNANIPAETITTTPDGRIFLVAAPQNVSSLMCE